MTPDQDALIRRAADIVDTSVTAFVLDTVTRRAHKVLADHDTLVLSNQSFDRFLHALDEPARAVPELVELFEQHPPFEE